MPDPTAWGAIPVTPPAATGPAAWGAQPLDEAASAQQVAGDVVSGAMAPILRIPRMQREEAEQGLAMMREGGARMLDFGSTSAVPESVKGLGEAALGGYKYVTSWPGAALRSVVGQPIEDVTRAGLEKATGSPKVAKIGSELVGGLAETGAGLALGELLPVGPRVRPTPPTPATQRLGVTLTKGEESQDLVQLARERDAREGRLGGPAQRQALEFDAERQRQLATATENVRRSYDPGGQVIAPGPQEAAEIAQQGVHRAATAAKAATDAAYTEARAIPGEVDVMAFRQMGPSIRHELWQGTEPIIVDEAMTPHAAAMIRDLSDQPARLARRIGYRVPEGEDIAGLPLDMVDRIRRRLSGLRQGAFKSGKQEDMRAAAAVLDAFDDRIESAIHTGLFTGDPLVIEAWNTARAAHADYRTLFRKGGGPDSVGGVVEKIVGRHGTDAAIPNDVADFLYGTTGVNPKTLNVRVASRLREVLGADSEQWTAVRQGLFSRLTERGPGQAEFSHGQVADRLNKFLNADGREMANVIFTRDQRAMLQEYANLRSTIRAAPTNAPASVARLSDRVLEFVGGRAAQGLGHVASLKTGVPMLGHVARYGAQKALQRVPSVANARAIADEMPVIGKAWQDYARAATAYERARNVRNIAKVTLAARNLDRNLRDIGTSLSALMGQDRQQQQPSGQPAQPAP